ncbi:MAG: type 4 pilin-like protein essential for motility [Cyanobacteriota bacterium]|jgi:type II secretory pathway pseudopilin PulG
MPTKTLLNYFKINAPKAGFTLTENLVSLIVLSTTLTVMMPAFMNFGMQNAKNRQISAATAITNSIMSDLRRQSVDELNDNLGKTVATYEQMGNTYQVEKYICTNLTGSPLDASDPDGTCSETVGQNDKARQILVEVKAPNDSSKTIYRIQTVFSDLRS